MRFGPKNLPWHATVFVGTGFHQEISAFAPKLGHIEGSFSASGAVNLARGCFAFDLIQL